jgi:hypothetical protein
MLVNKKSSNTSRVKFISYTGEYPNLCSGVLTLEIDGVQYKFGHNYLAYHFDDKGVGRFTDEDPEHPNFNSFWTSGGSVSHDGHWNWEVDTDEWEIDVNELPEQFWDVADEINEVFNENVPFGCCGGCI